jgi:hypothetical protein
MDTGNENIDLSRTALNAAWDAILLHWYNAEFTYDESLADFMIDKWRQVKREGE